MEFGAATATLPKKLSSGYGVAGRSAYDGVFASPVKLRAPSFSSRFEDYREIFGSAGGGGASLGSSIPVLELPELNDERSKIDEVRGSKLDYSAVFGGFRNLDAAVRFEELVTEPKKHDSFANGASARSKANEGDQSCWGDPTNYSKETPVVSQSSNDAKRINMSYHKVNQGSENGTNGTTHVAHPVPAYTCLVEEVNPVKMNRANKSIPAAPDAYSSNHYNEGIKKAGHHAVDSPDNAKKQSSNKGVKVKNRSNSIDLFFDACETSDGSNGTHHIEVPPTETKAGDRDNSNGDAMRSTATRCQASKSDTPEGAAHADSPSYLDDMVDSNSEAAASVAALRKAIEEAQLRLKVAKESMRRKKEGFPDRMKRKSNIDLKADVKKEAEVPYKTKKHEEIKTRQTFGETDALPQVSSEVGRPMIKEQVRSDVGAKEMFVVKEAVQEAQRKLQSTKAEHKEEVENKEADHNAKVLELKEAEINKKLLYNKNTGKVYEKPEESDHTIEVVKGYWEQEEVCMGNEAHACEELANETKHRCQEKISAANEASACEELVNETKHRCQEVVDETKLVQVTPDSGMINKRLNVSEDGEAENIVTPFHEPEDLKSNLVGQGLITGNEKQFAFKPEDDGKNVERSLELEEDKRNLIAIEELSEVVKNTAQEQKEIEENVEVSSELEECEFTEFLDPIDNEIVSSPHGSDLVSVEGKTQNLGCLEDRKKVDEAAFLDKNQETEHSCQREATEYTFSNVYMQEVLEEIVDHIHDEEEICERITKDSELDDNERVQDAKASENELEGGFLLMEENERGIEDNSEPVEVIRVTQIDPNYKEIKAEEAGKSTETSSSYEPDETEKLIKIQVADTIIANEEALKVTPEFYSHDVQDDIMVASDGSFQHQGKYGEPESVQETSDFCKKHAAETSVSLQDAFELNEAVNQMQSTSAAVTSDTNIGETDTQVRQNEDQCLETAENDCNLAAHVEETTAVPVDICNDAKEPRVPSNEEIDENRSNSSNGEDMFDNEHNIEVCQIPSMSEWKSSLFKEEEVKSIQSSLNENHQASMTMTIEEKEAPANLQKLELEKELLKKIDEAKERERGREREREKLAVERAIREARERAFADARERAALERAAAEARQKNIDGRERLGKTTGQANEKTLAEKALMEAKLKAERAAVERATAEARARALERALSEKAASEARNKYEKSDQYFGASRENGMKQNFHSKSFSYGEVRDSTDVFDGANGDSAERCKARSERHQRIGERVAKALAEKNMRDRLLQKEQEERNRIAEALDADVKRWSSGKAGNLRALLSTLQYILGPDSGWQPIPLTDIVTATAVRKAYRKATLFVHPDKLQQRGASIQQKYTCEKVFDLLKEAWSRFNMEER